MLGDVPSLRKALLRHIVRLTNKIFRGNLILILSFIREKLPSLSFPVGVSQVDTASREKATIAVFHHENNENQLTIKTSRDRQKLLVDFHCKSVQVLLGRVAIYTSAGAAEVLDTDIYTSNGIIHVIEHVV